MSPQIRPHTPLAGDARVLLDQVRESVGPKDQRLSSTIVANLLAAVLLLMAMQNHAGAVKLYGWFALMVAFQLTRAKVSRAYWIDATTDGHLLERWMVKLNWLSIASGLVWGCTGWLFFDPESVAHQALLAVLLCALAAGSIPANAMLRWGMQGSAFSILALLMVRLGLENDRNHWLMVMMLTVYLVFVLKWGRDLNAVLTLSLHRRHQNLDLIEQLQQQTQAAKDAQRSAEQANLAKSKFLAAASHDLRQPMYALSLFSGVMAGESRPARLQDLAKHIAVSVDALEMLFNALLDISKLDAGVTSVEKTDFALQNTFLRLANDFTPLAHDKGLNLTVAPTEARVHTDPQLLEQVLRNLLANAIRYTETGQVSVMAVNRAGLWHVEVIDSGIGIASTELDKVFDEFYQVSNPERDRSKGLGLGLAIVRRLTLLLNLPLTLISQPGQGTRVSVSVPPAGPENSEPAKAPAPGPDRFEDLRVLVVDDEPQVRAAMTLILTSWGCRVVGVESHAEVVAHLTSNDWKPDIALVDYRLRGGFTGVAVLDWLRQHASANLPCAIITGDTAADQLRDITASGFRLVHKPVSPQQLKQLLGELTSG